MSGRLTVEAHKGEEYERGTEDEAEHGGAGKAPFACRRGKECSRHVILYAGR